MSERVVSVESDLETLWRTSCEGEKTGGRCKIRLFRSDDDIRNCARPYRDQVSCRKTERCTGASTLARAVTTARGSPVMRTARTLSACMMSGDHAVVAVMACCLAGAMHGTGHNWSCCAAQRRNPRRQQNHDQRYGDQSAHHDVNLRSR